MISVVPPPRKPSPMGMDKSGNSSLNGSGWTKIPNWTARSGFPNTSIVTDGLVMDGTGSGAVTFRGQDSGSGRPFQAYLNGSPIGTQASNGTVGTVSGVTVNPGDRLELYVNLTGFLLTVTGGSTNTYLYFTPD